MPARIPDEELLDDLRAVADELGRAPKRAEYREYGEYFTKTLTEHFGGWVEALDAAGLDPDTRAIGEGLQVSCPQCDNENRYSGDREEWICPSCRARVPVWWARVHRLAQTPVLHRLADGPKTRAELGQDPSQTAREFIDVHRPTSTGPASDDPVVVLYLYGDDRGALRRFIEVNRAFVSEELANGRNPIASDPEGALFQMLVQQWEWMDAEEE